MPSPVVATIEVNKHLKWQFAVIVNKINPNKIAPYSMANNANGHRLATAKALIVAELNILGNTVCR